MTRDGKVRLHRAAIGGIGMLAVLLAMDPSWGGVDPCPVPEADRIPADQHGAPFPYKALDQEARCLIGAIVSNPTTSGEIGPVHIPISQALYEYLLDHPVLMASLVRRFDLGAYQFTVKGPNQYWGDDGDGTQGLLSRVHRDDAWRVYYVDGFHEGHVFPMVKVKAVVFLRFAPVVVDGRPGVDILLIGYTKLNDPVLSAFVYMLRPLIGQAVTQKMTQVFDVTNQLGTIMAGEPGRVLQEMASLPLAPEERQVLSAHLQGLAVNALLPMPARAKP